MTMLPEAKVSLASLLIAALQLLAHSGLPHTAGAFSAPLPSTPPLSAATAVETTARKRTGRKSFLLKQERNKLQPILTPSELHNLGLSLSKRKRGSHSFYKGWMQWRTAALDAIRDDLSHNLPHPANKTKFENLFFRLGVASDVGQMPSFEDAGARSGYAIEFFCRARNLADLYIDGWNPQYEFPQFWIDSLMETVILGGESGYGETSAKESMDGPYSMVSLGGGPGFDYVSAALATSYCSYTSSSKSLQEQHNTAIKATILDYEEGWGDLVHAMGNSTQYTLQNSQLQCDWGGKCDITKTIFHPTNEACLQLVNTTNLWTCQYCVAENANLLQESKYIFFRDLFQHSREGALFVLSEVHPRLWPDFYHLIQEYCPYMSIGFNRNGRQMLMRKGRSSGDVGNQEKSSLLISKKDQQLVQKFEALATYHERKINKGWVRQVPKRREV